MASTVATRDVSPRQRSAASCDPSARRRRAGVVSWRDLSSFHDDPSSLSTAFRVRLRSPGGRLLSFPGSNCESGSMDEDTDGNRLGTPWGGGRDREGCVPPVGFDGMTTGRARPPPTASYDDRTKGRCPRPAGHPRVRRRSPGGGRGCLWLPRTARSPRGTARLYDCRDRPFDVGVDNADEDDNDCPHHTTMPSSYRSILDDANGGRAWERGIPPPKPDRNDRT